MAAFKLLRDVCVNFDQQLVTISDELFAAKVDDTFEEDIMKHIRDSLLHTGKLRLLQASPTAATPRIENQQRDEPSTIVNYTETVRSKLIEQQLVKAVTQAHAVEALVCACDTDLDPEMVERKEKILEQMSLYRSQEMMLMELEAELSNKLDTCEMLRAEWAQQCALLRDMREDGNNRERSLSDPLHRQLNNLENKSKQIRALLGAFAMMRGPSLDWSSDPRYVTRLRALKLARHGVP